MTPHPNEESAPDACEHGWHKRYVRPCPECAPPPALPSAAVEQLARPEFWTTMSSRDEDGDWHRFVRVPAEWFDNLPAAITSQVADLTRQRDEARAQLLDAGLARDMFANLASAATDEFDGLRERAARLEAALARIRELIGTDDPGYQTIYVIARDALALSGTAPAEDAPE